MVTLAQPDREQLRRAAFLSVEGTVMSFAVTYYCFQSKPPIDW